MRSAKQFLMICAGWQDILSSWEIKLFSDYNFLMLDNKLVSRTPLYFSTSTGPLIKFIVLNPSVTCSPTPSPPTPNKFNSTFKTIFVKCFSFRSYHSSAIMSITYIKFRLFTKDYFLPVLYYPRRPFLCPTQPSLLLDIR